MIREIFDFIKNNKWYVLLVALLLGLYFYQFHGGLSSKSEKWDHFGSYIGGIFSAVTLLTVLHSMQLERKRFEKQRLEFEKEREEQNKNNEIDIFEKRYFYLLQLLNEAISRVEKPIENGVKTAIEFAYEDLCSNSSDYLRSIISERINVCFNHILFILGFVRGKDLFYVNYLMDNIPRKMKILLLFYISQSENKASYVELIRGTNFMQDISDKDLNNETVKSIYKEMLEKMQEGN